MAAGIKNPRGSGEATGKIDQKVNHVNINIIARPMKNSKGVLCGERKPYSIWPQKRLYCPVS